jgi:zinc/manganese transport system permease protein
VVEREVIFVDLSLAQLAVLGAAVATLCGLDPHDPPTDVAALAFPPCSSPSRSASGW